VRTELVREHLAEQRVGETDAKRDRRCIGFAPSDPPQREQHRHAQSRKP
jgi:hypothetical protein